MIYKALSVVTPAGDKIRSGEKQLEVRRWAPETLPLRNLLIIQNSHRLSSAGLQEHPDGRAVALVDITAVRNWEEKDLNAACALTWEPGWLAWEISNVRPFDWNHPLPAKLRIYEVELGDFEDGRDRVPTIKLLTDLNPAQVEPILAASRREGFHFVDRLCAEWASGVNRFQQHGEALFGVFSGAALVGIGGVNRQTETTGRLRRFYILPDYRRWGLGRLLLRKVLAHASGHFRCIVLRTDTNAGDQFYRACGFVRLTDSGDTTHRIELAFHT